MPDPAASLAQAGRMDGIYRRQRHIYDLTRKFYLLGRDRMIAGLDIPDGAAVLELGCGTGRNLIRAARRQPRASYHGIDISSQMLTTARRNLEHAHLGHAVRLARADASAFDPVNNFGRTGFDRIYLSYALSMIPEWESAIRGALDALAPCGSLHIVDFGRQQRLPRPFKKALRAWLAWFHVTPRDDLFARLDSECKERGLTLFFESLFSGYACRAIVSEGTPGSVNPMPG